MSLIYWIDQTNQILRSLGTGPLSIDDLRNYFAATRADPRFIPTMHRLMDLRQVTNLPPSSEIRVLAHLARDMAPAPEARMAIVASSDLAFGVSMMFKGLVGFGDRLIVVRDEAEALAWLNDPMPRSGDHASDSS